MMNRRFVLKTGGAVALASSIGPWPIARAADTLTVAAYGGEFEDIFRRTVMDPFEKKFSCKIIYDNSNSQTGMYAKMRAGRGTANFDIAAEMAAGQIILGAKEKLLEEITEKQVPNLKYVWDVSRKIIPPYGIVQNYQYLALIWNKNKIKPPTSWLDYWQAQKVYGEDIKGRVLSHGMSNYELAAYALIMGAKATGGDERHMDNAWDMLKALHPYFGPVVDTSAAAVPYMENSEVWIGPYWSARSVYYIKRGLPIAHDHPQGGHHLPRHHLRRPDRLQKQTARLRIHELPPGPRDPARLLPRIQHQPRPPRHHRLARRLRRPASHHARSHGQDDLPRPRIPGRPAARLDRKMARHHGQLTRHCEERSDEAMTPPPPTPPRNSNGTHPKCAPNPGPRCSSPGSPPSTSSSAS